MGTEQQTNITRSRGRASLVSNMLLVVAACLVGILSGELLLRLFNVSYTVFIWTDPVRGVSHIPGAKGRADYGSRHVVEINSQGWRGPEVAIEHPPGTFRIALLGDSFIEAFEVPFEETVGEVLERRLSELWQVPVEVLNFGQGGYGTAQQQLTLHHEVWKYSPDLVLLAITTANDISDNYRPLKDTDYVPYYVYQGDSLVLDNSFTKANGYRNRALWTRRLLSIVQHSRLAQLINRVRHQRRKDERRARNVISAETGEEVGLHSEVYLPPAAPEWKEAWKVTEGILRMMRNECRTQQTPFALVTLTTGRQVNPEREVRGNFMRELGVGDLYYPERRLSEFGSTEGIPVLNLAPSMAQQAEQQQVYFHSDRDSLGVGHWNRAGHRAAGTLIANWLGGSGARGVAVRPRALKPQP
jgi:hypothetical protein